MLTDVGSTEIPVTGVDTVTVLSPCISPLTVTAKIVAVPFPTPVTIPTGLTVAIPVFDEDHRTVLLEEVDGRIVGVRVVVLPAFTFTDEGVIEIDVGITAGTVPTEVILKSPLLAVIVTDPAEIPFTRPDELTVAIVVSLLEY
jgi:hypothetical protein